MDHIEVHLVRWPADRGQLASLQTEQEPRLLLVAADAPPPQTVDPLEDWVRLPADPIELTARADKLRSIAAVRGSTPRIDEGGVLRQGKKLLPLRPLDALLVGVMLDRLGRVVRNEMLSALAWPQGPPSKTALHDRIARFAPEIVPFGLRTHRIRARGYMLEFEYAAS